MNKIIKFGNLNKVTKIQVDKTPLVLSDEERSDGGLAVAAALASSHLDEELTKTGSQSLSRDLEKSTKVKDPIELDDLEPTQPIDRKSDNGQSGADGDNTNHAGSSWSKNATMWLTIATIIGIIGVIFMFRSQNA